MPTLVANYQEKANVTKVKKIYSVLSQAYLMAQQEYGDPTNWDLIASGNIQGAQNMAEKFKPYLKVVSEKINDKEPQEYQYNLADGSQLTFVVRSPQCSQNRGPGSLSEVCGIINYDRHSFDWSFSFTKNGLIPKGVPEDTLFPFSRCLGGENSACTAWVIYNENMDYLHCKYLNWSGKTKCD